MGRLIVPEQMTPDPSWYLDTAYWNRDGNRWQYRLDEDSKVHGGLRVHRDYFKENLQHRIEVRRYVEQDLPDTVLMTREDYGYNYTYWYRGKDRYGSDNLYSRDHGYYRFYFENPASVLLFKLRFSTIITDFHQLHPDDIGSESLRARLAGCPDYIDGQGRKYGYLDQQNHIPDAPLWDFTALPRRR